MKKMLMLYNPCSGDGRIKDSLSELVDELTKNGYLVTVYPTQFAGDAQATIEKEGAAFDRIVVCGGDGMMHEAINGWIHGKSLPTLAYVPSGTVNDFANTHGIPRDMLTAAQVAASNSWTYLDVGQFNEEYFSYVAAFGVGTSVSYKTPQEKKKILGPTAYILEALNTVDFAHWENNCETMKITWKGGEASGDFLYGMVSNSKYVAGTDVFTKDLFNWHDGLLEGLFIRRPMNLVELNTIIAGITRSDFSGPLFIQVQSPWFDFVCDQSAWTLDGEFGGVHDHVVAKAVPRALKMVLSEEHIKAEGSSLIRPVLPNLQSDSDLDYEHYTWTISPSKQDPEGIGQTQLEKRPIHARSALDLDVSSQKDQPDRNEKPVQDRMEDPDSQKNQDSHNLIEQALAYSASPLKVTPHAMGPHYALSDLYQPERVEALRPEVFQVDGQDPADRLK
ncbi:YegS/Rv2252/BmrU family lipid kinase [Erysipelotrichaceae bacterium RD49]|nr:YegS/Rv2252/BmrU family lipid kinase [Erysipelotrichaceae bacterium RD49]